MADTLSSLLPPDVEDLARNILQFASDRRLMVATAESCTGGLLSSILTDVEGLSSAFERGFCVYTNEAKVELLNVSEALIKKKGAVSADVAIAMAKGAIRNSRADAVVSVTGFAGRAGDDDEPGLVHLAALARKGTPRNREEHLGDLGRTAVREAACRIALQMLSEVLVESQR